MPQLTGGCLCGQVRYSANAEPMFAGVCHCRDCQKETGSAFNTVIAVPQAALSIQGPVEDLHAERRQRPGRRSPPVPELRLDDHLRAGGDARRQHPARRHPGRPVMGQAGDGDLLRQQAALGSARRRAAKLPEDAAAVVAPFPAPIPGPHLRRAPGPPSCWPAASARTDTTDGARGSRLGLRFTFSLD